jgi:hypothetical protein
VCHSRAVRIGADECSRRVNRAGRAADCAGLIETLEGPFLGHCKAVGNTARARSHHTRKSCHFTRRVATGEHGTIRPWEVNRRVLSIVQNAAVARARRVEVAAPRETGFNVWSGWSFCYCLATEVCHTPASAKQSKLFLVRSCGLQCRIHSAFESKVVFVLSFGFRQKRDER